MNLVQEKVLSTLQAGDWIFSDLQALFLDALRSQKQVRDGIHVPLMIYEGIALKTSGRSVCISRDAFAEIESYEKFSAMVHDIGQADDFSNEEKLQLYQTFDIFNHQFPGEADLMQLVFSGFVRIRGGQFSGSSNPRAWGIFFLGDRFFELNENQRAVSFVHEMAHHELFLIQLLDRLANKEADSSLVYAPLQGKPRPPIKRLHSLWALFRMLQFSRDYGIEHADIQNKFKQNAKSFLNHELTQFGQKLLSKVITCVDAQVQSFSQSSGTRW